MSGKARNSNGDIAEGVFVQKVLPGSLAEKDGRLVIALSCNLVFRSLSLPLSFSLSLSLSLSLSPLSLLSGFKLGTCW